MIEPMPGKGFSLVRKVHVPKYAHSPGSGHTSYAVDLNPLFDLRPETAGEILAHLPAYYAQIKHWAFLTREARTYAALALIQDIQKTSSQSVSFIEKYLLHTRWEWSIWAQQLDWLESVIVGLEWLQENARSLNANRRTELDPTKWTNK